MLHFFQINLIKIRFSIRSFILFTKKKENKGADRWSYLISFSKFIFALTKHFIESNNYTRHTAKCEMLESLEYSQLKRWELPDPFHPLPSFPSCFAIHQMQTRHRSTAESLVQWNDCRWSSQNLGWAEYNILFETWITFNILNY